VPPGARLSVEAPLACLYVRAALEPLSPAGSARVSTLVITAVACRSLNARGDPKALSYFQRSLRCSWQHGMFRVRGPPSGL
jgi:hypothetical protein